VVHRLGGNDGLRGLPLVANNKRNLERMIKASKTAGAQVLLVGMRIPPNYGREIHQGFEGNYTALAKQYDVPLVPFLLEPHRQRSREFPGRQPPPRGECAAQVAGSRVEDAGAVLK
jgi:lysophospholipase L1-like esterase